MVPANFTPNDFSVVDFADLIHPRISIQPKYFELGFSGSPKIYGRGAVRDRLLAALELLPPDYGFHIWDIYRPRSVQAVLFDWMRAEIKKRSPQLTDEENFAEACNFAALPSSLGEFNCSPHLSGGAIDLTLFEVATGNIVDMGTVFDDCSEHAYRDYFNKLTVLTAEQQLIKTMRDYLRNAMERVGFVSYEYEWWHFDIGDRLWGKVTGHAPVFGPLFDDNEWPA